MNLWSPGLIGVTWEKRPGKLKVKEYYSVHKSEKNNHVAIKYNYNIPFTDSLANDSNISTEYLWFPYEPKF